MSITSKATPRQLIPADNYAARCYSMIELGTIKEVIQGKEQINYKVRISWELPTEMKVFDEAKGPQPLVIHKEYTLSLGKKANLRKDIDSWRGKPLTEDEAKKFDITVLVGKPCMLNIIHKTSQTSGNDYELISGVTPVPKGMKVPPQINMPQILAFDSWNDDVFKSLPQFLTDKIQSSKEYAKMMNGDDVGVDQTEPIADDLPF